MPAVIKITALFSRLVVWSVIELSRPTGRQWEELGEVKTCIIEVRNRLVAIMRYLDLGGIPEARIPPPPSPCATNPSPAVTYRKEFTINWMKHRVMSISGIYIFPWIAEQEGFYSEWRFRCRWREISDRFHYCIRKNILPLQMLSWKLPYIRPGIITWHFGSQ